MLNLFQLFQYTLYLSVLLGVFMNMILTVSTNHTALAIVIVKDH